MGLYINCISLQSDKYSRSLLWLYMYLANSKVSIYKVIGPVVIRYFL